MNINAITPITTVDTKNWNFDYRTRNVFGGLSYKLEERKLPSAGKTEVCCNVEFRAITVSSLR
jgi:hypothetical protein